LNGRALIAFCCDLNDESFWGHSLGGRSSVTSDKPEQWRLSIDYYGNIDFDRGREQSVGVITTDAIIPHHQSTPEWSGPTGITSSPTVTCTCRPRSHPRRACSKAHRGKQGAIPIYRFKPLAAGIIFPLDHPPRLCRVRIPIPQSNRFLIAASLIDEARFRALPWRAPRTGAQREFPCRRRNPATTGCSAGSVVSHAGQARPIWTSHHRGMLVTVLSDGANVTRLLRSTSPAGDRTLVAKDFPLTT